MKQNISREVSVRVTRVSISLLMHMLMQSLRQLGLGLFQKTTSL